MYRSTRRVGIHVICVLILLLTACGSDPVRENITTPVREGVRSGVPEAGRPSGDPTALTVRPKARVPATPAPRVRPHERPAAAKSAESGPEVVVRLKKKKAPFPSLGAPEADPTVPPVSEPEKAAPDPNEGTGPETNEPDPTAAVGALEVPPVVSPKPAVANPRPENADPLAGAPAEEPTEPVPPAPNPESEPVASSPTAGHESPSPVADPASTAEVSPVPPAVADETPEAGEGWLNDRIQFGLWIPAATSPALLVVMVLLLVSIRRNRFRRRLSRLFGLEWRGRLPLNQLRGFMQAHRNLDERLNWIRGFLESSGASVTDDEDLIRLERLVRSVEQRRQHILNDVKALAGERRGSETSLERALRIHAGRMGLLDALDDLVQGLSEVNSRTAD